MPIKMEMAYQLWYIDTTKCCTETKSELLVCTKVVGKTVDMFKQSGHMKVHIPYDSIYIYLKQS